MNMPNKLIALIGLCLMLATGCEKSAKNVDSNLIGAGVAFVDSFVPEESCFDLAVSQPGRKRLSKKCLAKHFGDQPNILAVEAVYSKGILIGALFLTKEGAIFFQKEKDELPAFFQHYRVQKIADRAFSLKR